MVSCFVVSGVRCCFLFRYSHIFSPPFLQRIIAYIYAECICAMCTNNLRIFVHYLNVNMLYIGMLMCYTYVCSERAERRTPMKWKDWQSMTPEQKQAAFTEYKKKWLATANS
nr:MAG TPA: hypothetical protein [Caudoviricetes sp.]